MNHHPRLVVGLSSSGRPVEVACDAGAVVDQGELVMEFVVASEA